MIDNQQLTGEQIIENWFDHYMNSEMSGLEKILLENDRSF